MFNYFLKITQYKLHKLYSSFHSFTTHLNNLTPFPNQKLREITWNQSSKTCLPTRGSFNNSRVTTASLRVLQKSQSSWTHRDSQSANRQVEFIFTNRLKVTNISQMITMYTSFVILALEQNPFTTFISARQVQLVVVLWLCLSN